MGNSRLLPTVEEVERFTADSNAGAWPALIDRLLDSPQYGAQMGRRWLDVVRYADSAGFSNDFDLANAWRYRDYVIRSFNRDTPFDRFVREQIAGDELSDANAETVLATGFLRMGPWEHLGMAVAAETRQQWLDDVVNSVGNSFLGIEMSCFKCHDHKFDPLPTRDYYAMQAVFATTHPADIKLAFLPEENIAGFDSRKAEADALAGRFSKKSGQKGRVAGFNVTPESQQRMLGLLEKLDENFRQDHPLADQLRARLDAYQLAFRMQTSVPDLIDVTSEPGHVRRLYGIGEEPTDAFGRKCLLARKFVEAGSRFVQVISSDWDAHDDLAQNHGEMLGKVDKSVAGLLADLKQRGLLDSTLVVWAGEFGRSADVTLERPMNWVRKPWRPFIRCAISTSRSCVYSGWTITNSPTFIPVGSSS